MTFPPDYVEKQIANIDQAWTLLNNKLPEFKNLFHIWSLWHENILINPSMHSIISDAVIICYARMALRNGSLNEKPRHYHSEKHIEDLLLRLMAISELPETEKIPDYGWSVLSLFMCSHDLRQSENNQSNKNIIGTNEQASFLEIERLMALIDTKGRFQNEHKELLKLMIHGSTFSQGEDNNGNIYNGNLVDVLLKTIDYFEEDDKQLAFLACDIDTANVAAELTDYADSSINVYNEIQAFSNAPINAKTFFGIQQQQYFFVMQRFNSHIGVVAFSEQKDKNAPKIKTVCQAIIDSDEGFTNEEVVELYRQQIQTLV
jgi:hypothetical protein